MRITTMEIQKEFSFLNENEKLYSSFGLSIINIKIEFFDNIFNF
jgi:hypothetical protein